jgi:hypothetical protein
VGVERGDQGECDEFVDDEHGEDEGAQALRRVRRGHREEAQPQGCAGQCDPPAGGGGPAEVDGEVDRDGRRHPADGREQRHHEAPPLMQLSRIDLAACLEPRRGKRRSSGRC